jgi:hypothetical protein
MKGNIVQFSENRSAIKGVVFQLQIIIESIGLAIEWLSVRPALAGMAHEMNTVRELVADAKDDLTELTGRLMDEFSEISPPANDRG